MIPFVVFILLGSIFLGTYYREMLSTHECLMAIDEIEKLNSQPKFDGGYCNIVNLYIWIRNREDADKVSIILRELNMSVQVFRHRRWHISMSGSIRIENVGKLINLSEKNGWEVFYFNNTKHCSQRILELQQENQIIMAHLDSISPKSRKVLLKKVKRNKEYIERLEKEQRVWASVNIFVGVESQYTPNDFHELSGFLALWGTLIEVPFLLVVLRKNKVKENSDKQSKR